MSSTQKRCVFVGNIPYDATEEELIRICEEVGPVVSFRLVLDRDTGKPKGYGFCEFRDEETALSARRNLQGYEINGRQLRVDFAENEKGGVDRNREQGRGGPGFSSINDVHKHTGGVSSQVASTLLDPSINKPVGLSVAAAAAAVMAGALGASQMPMMMGQGANLGSNGQPNSSGIGAGAAIGSDPLTSHLASMSKHQLYEIVSQMKDLIQQNQQQARQILIANPQLTKALFQAQIMLGMVPPPAVMPSIQQPPGQNTSSQSQSQTQVPQQQIVHQPQMQPPQTQAVQPFHIQTAPQIQAIQQGQIQASQMQQHQMQAVQTSQSPDMEMQSTQSQMQAPQPSQILPFQHSLPPLQQSHAQTSSVQPPIQSVPQISSHSISMQPQVLSVQVAQPQPPPLQQSNLLPQHLQPPLPQQPRPPIPVPLSQLQLQPTQSMSFQLPSIPQQQSLPQLPFQQPGGLAQNSSMGLHYQQQPPLLNQPPPQQAFQMPRSGVDVSGGPGIGQGGISSSVGMMVGSISTGLGAPQVGRGPSMGVSSGPAPPMAWNQPPSSSGSMGVIAGVPHTSASMGMAGHMGPGHSLSMPGGPTGSGAPHIHQDINVKGFGSLRGNTGVGIGGPSEGLGVSGMVHSQGYTQVMQTPPHPQQQPQMQPSLELEQQKALLQQVMNLTPEQINSLPPEQRQQVMQLQQAFRN